MRKNRAAFLCSLVGFVAVGCAQSRQAVYVDYSKLVSTSDVGAAIYSPPNPPVSSGSTRHSQAVIAGRTLEEYASGRMDAAKQLLSDDRRHTVKEIEARLRRLYGLAADRVTKAKYGDLDPKRTAALREAETLIHAAFATYAAQRGPKLARLALLVGFPDPDPTSTKSPDPARALAEARFVEAKALRSDIVGLDAAFARQTQGYLKDAQDKIDEDLTQMRIDIQQRKDDADARAEAEAARLAAVNEASLGLSSRSMRDVQLSQVAPESVQPTSGPTPPAMGPTSIELDPTDTAGRIRALQSEVRIWAGIHGYSLVERGKGRDATEEFKEWAKHLTSGR